MRTALTEDLEGHRAALADTQALVEAGHVALEESEAQRAREHEAHAELLATREGEHQAVVGHRDELLREREEMLQQLASIEGARHEAQTLADARGATLRSRWELLKRLWRPSGD